MPGSAADEVIAEMEVDDLGRAWFGDAVSMRWVLIHMIEETARHAGHLDIMRELIDGADWRPPAKLNQPAEVRAVGVEPTWALAHRVLSPARLPFRHARK